MPNFCAVSHSAAEVFVNRLSTSEVRLSTDRRPQVLHSSLATQALDYRMSKLSQLQAGSGPLCCAVHHTLSAEEERQEVVLSQVPQTPRLREERLLLPLGFKDCLL